LEGVVNASLSFCCKTRHPDVISTFTRHHWSSTISPSRATQDGGNIIASISLQYRFHYLENVSSTLSYYAEEAGSSPTKTHILSGYVEASDLHNTASKHAKSSGPASTSVLQGCIEAKVTITERAVGAVFSSATQDSQYIFLTDFAPSRGLLRRERNDQYARL
jgi:hypothetical protein